MVTWIVIAVVVLALFVLVAAAAPLLGRLSTLQRAVRRLHLRQEQALRLQHKAEALQESVAQLQQRAELAADRVAVVRAARGERDGQPRFLGR